MTTDHTTLCNEGLEIVAYLAGVMPPEDRPRFEEHLARCDACRERLVAIHRMGGDIPESVEPVKLDRAWRRVEAALDAWTPAQPADSVPDKVAARVIRLRPRVRRPPQTSSCALAAATEQTPPLSAITMAADGEEIMGKLGRAEDGGDLLLYLIAEDLSGLAGSRVAARDEESGSLAEGSPDDYGVVPLPDTSGWNPTKMLVEVHLPG